MATSQRKRTRNNNRLLRQQYDEIKTSSSSSSDSDDLPQLENNRYFNVTTQGNAMQNLAQFVVIQPKEQDDNIVSLDAALERLKPFLQQVLNYKFSHPPAAGFGVKVSCQCNILTEKQILDEEHNVEGDNTYEYKLQLSGSMDIKESTSISRQVNTAIHELQNIFEQVVTNRGSGYRFKHFLSCNLSFAYYSMKKQIGDENYRNRKHKAGSYIKLPGNGQVRFIINPQNKDNRCFEWCLMVYHWHNKIFANKHKVSQYLKFTNPNHKEYDESFEGFKWSDGKQHVSFPVSEKDIDIFEELNPNYSINIYSYEYINKSQINKVPIKVSQQSNAHTRKFQVDLIKLSNDGNHHFAVITDFNQFMCKGCKGESSENTSKRYYCRRDLCSFPSIEKLNDHINNFCRKQQVALSFPDEKVNELEFKKFHAKLQTPYYIVADLESINKIIIGECYVCKRDITELDLKLCDVNECDLPHNDYNICKSCHDNHEWEWELDYDTFGFKYKKDGSNYEFTKSSKPIKPKQTENIYEQRANSWAFYVVNTFDYTQNQRVELDFIIDENDYEDLGARFVQKLMETGETIMMNIKTANAPMIITEEDQKVIDVATTCWICNYPLHGHSQNGDPNKHGDKRAVDQQWFKEIKENAYKYKYDRQEFENTDEYKQWATSVGVTCYKDLEISDDMDEITKMDIQYKQIEKNKLYKEFLNKRYSYHSVRDHCHFTGKFRGMAHNCCNLHFNYRNKFKIPVWFHNLRGYDSHFVFQWLQRKSMAMDDQDLNKLRIIPQNTEKFISFSFADFQFIDSFGFFGSSLEKLVDGLMGRDDKLNSRIETLLKYTKSIESRFVTGTASTQEYDYIYPALTKELKECEMKRDAIEAKGLKNFKFINQEYERDLSLPVHPDNDKKALSLLLEKGSWAYEYFTHVDDFSEPRLPAKIEYAKKIAKISETEWDYKKISDEDYQKELDKWDLFNMQTIRDAHDLYLKIDVISLADVLESRRIAMYEAFGLDYMWYLSLPGFAWDTMLMRGFENPKTKKRERIRLEVFHDQQANMYEMIEKGIRGGICQISHRLSEANNKYLDPEKFGYQVAEPRVKMEEDEKIENKESNYLWYVDANQLYSWAMTQPLPYNNFNWINSLTDVFPGLTDATNMEEVTKHIQLMKDDAEKGYIFMVDLEYPEELHDSHSDYPLAPEPMTIEKHELSPFTQQLQIDCKLKPMKVKKLYTTLTDKTNYIIHYRNLKFYLKQGMKLKAIKKSLKFTQRPWIKDFIDFCVNKRQTALTDWDKDMYKLMCNAVYGKTMECETNRIDFNVVNCDGKYNKKYQRLVRSPFYETTTQIAHNSNLVGVLMKRTKAKLTKPKATGFAVLDLSKLLMYSFYYEKLRSVYDHTQTKLCMTDTDSLELSIKTDDLYQDMLKPNSKLAECLDFSNYALPLNIGNNIILKSWFNRYPEYIKQLVIETKKIGGNIKWFDLNETEYLLCITGITKIPKLVNPTKSDNYIFPPTVLLNGFMSQNNKVCGKFKDEWGGWLLTLFAGNKAKSYSNIDEKLINTKKLKGIPKEVLKKRIQHEHYVNVIKHPTTKTHLTFMKLGSQQHAIYFYQKTMIAMCSYDDKRYVLPDNIFTRAFGHKSNLSELCWKYFQDFLINPSQETIIKKEEDKLIQEYGNIIYDTDENDYMYIEELPMLE